MTKYFNQKFEVNGVKWDSKKEYQRYQELLLLEKATKISNLNRQVKFEIIPKQQGERSVNYIADFTYIEQGKLIVEDVKSPYTRKLKDYIIKRKLMKLQGYDFREV